jgi:hypothetical protein
MAVVRYADQYRCDTCGVTGEGAPPHRSATGTPEGPAGWVSAGIADQSMRAMQVHLCGPCAQAPFASVLAQLAAG